MLRVSQSRVSGNIVKADKAGPGEVGLSTLRHPVLVSLLDSDRQTRAPCL